MYAIRSYYETTFDSAEVRRHMSVLVLTDSRLLRVHIDDGAGPESGGEPAASATVESAPLRSVTSVALTHVVHHPEQFREGDAPHELVLAVGWGVHSRIDLDRITSYNVCYTKLLREGDSALGTAKLARRSDFQALLPIRGKRNNFV